MAKEVDITFRDLPKREEKAVSDLRAEKARLDDRVKRGVATEDEKKTLSRVEPILVYYTKTNKAGRPPIELVDSLFVAARDAFNRNPGLLGKVVLNHSGGKIETQRAIDFDDVVKISLVVGFLAADRVEAPWIALV